MTGSRKIKNTVPMVLRTFEVLEVFRERSSGLSYKEVIERFPHIPAASIYRILCSLEATGYLLKDEQTNRYGLGVKFIEMGRLSEKRQDIVRHAQPHMQQLLQEFGENVNLIKVHGTELVYLATLEGQHPLRVAEMRNRRHCVHSSASGKVFLAFLPENEMRERVGDLELAELTPHSITSREEFVAELERVRKRRYALDAEENMLGVSCVASVILNLEGYPMAAISVSAPTFRMPARKIEVIAERLIQESSLISTSCFGKSPSPKEDEDHQVTMLQGTGAD